MTYSSEEQIIGSTYRHVNTGSIYYITKENDKIKISRDIGTRTGCSTKHDAQWIFNALNKGKWEVICEPNNIDNYDIF